MPTSPTGSDLHNSLGASVIVIPNIKMEHPYENHNDDASTLGSKSLSDQEEEDRSISGSNHSLPRIITAGDEMESLCRAEMSGGSAATLGYPPTCMPIVRLLAGNHCCVDCGDEDMNHLKYASIGYGTILCQDCAHRHVTMSEDESKVKSLKEDDWNLRCTLAILEGSNNHMLEYVKHKPRWRPSKGDNESYSEDVLAFKQIYLSKSAGTYRKNLAKRVDDAFYSRITCMREEDAAREVRLQKIAALSNSDTSRDPFRHIFEQNNVSAEDIPEFFSDDGGGGKASYRTITSSPRNSDPNLARDNGDAGVKLPATKPLLSGGTRRSRNSLSNTLMKHESPSLDLIKERINMRRNMNSSIAVASAASQQRRATSDTLATLGTLEKRKNGDDATTNKNNDPAPFPSEKKQEAVAVNMRRQPPPPQIKPRDIASGYRPAGNRRRASVQDQIVGEVRNSTIQDQYDGDQTTITEGSMAIRQQQWSKMQVQNGLEDEKSLISRGSRATTAAPLGRYRRMSQGEIDGAGKQEQIVPRRTSTSGRGVEGRLVAQQRSRYRPTKRYLESLNKI